MLTEKEQRVKDVIAGRQSALLEDLRLHVGIPTGGFNYPAIEETRERLVGRLMAIGAGHEEVAGDPKPTWLPGSTPAAGDAFPTCSVCTKESSGDRAPVLVAGHMDTVHDPASDFRELNIGPDKKTATGPGCVDMKGGLVIAVAALEALAEVGVDVGWTFTLNTDEETGTYHSEQALRDQAAKHEFGIALEPALPGGELAVERLGSGQFMVECKGRSAHVGRAFTDGVSAVTKLAECLTKIATFPDPDAGRIISVGPIEGGAATNAVPDRASAWGNVRFPTQEASDHIASQLEALVTDPEAMPAVALHRSFNRPAKPLIPATEALAMQARGVAESLGQKLPFAKTGGVCDGNILQDAGLPTIDTLGVRGGGLHTPNEWIELDSLVERCQLLAILILRLNEAA